METGAINFPMPSRDKKLLVVAGKDFIGLRGAEKSYSNPLSSLRQGRAGQEWMVTAYRCRRMTIALIA